MTDTTSNPSPSRGLQKVGEGTPKGVSRRALLLGTGALLARPAHAKTELRVENEEFLLNGKPTFLLGISYYAGLGASKQILADDLAELKRRKFNWIRVWASWDAFGNLPALTPNGAPREPELSLLKALVARFDGLGMALDVTLSRGKTLDGTQWFPTPEAHLRAVETIVTALEPWRNWYLDLSNERNIRDTRYTSDGELKTLRAKVRQLDPGRLVTASHGGDIDEADLKDYVRVAGVDFITPHRPRDADSPAKTEEVTRRYRQQLAALGRRMPVHYQEPFRRGYASWEPSAADFVRDLEGARKGGASGWCFHNGDQRKAPDHLPRRSFDLRERGLFAQLDPEERAFVDNRAVSTRYASPSATIGISEPVTRQEAAA